MLVALASPPIAASIDDGLEHCARLMDDAAAAGAHIICFPEAYLPGLRGLDFTVPDYAPADQDRVLVALGDLARTRGLALIMGMERIAATGRQIAAAVFDAEGTFRGFQTKNQLDPTEEWYYVPGSTRRVFTVDGLTFGIAICHEGWRYPETVRWAAVRGARIVFHPQHTGSDQTGMMLTEWGSPAAPYYEKAMVCRSIENGIWFASVNYGMRFQESATSLIAPSGECRAHLPYGGPGLLVHDVDLDEATGTLARRFAPDRYAESSE
jgi:predicted amidohydrolase